ncbi:Hypothetical protein CINCED_3A017926 [Cinara cedri]|uniref:Uncharacterized protein n=1 Tax=Cinara cedri TaxID=506608 RepID=A0A5E4N711_9HEMI|nr:Hypothetical protein CINCED_3A017926 [Cinara cedri]
MWKSEDESNEDKSRLEQRTKPILDHDGVEEPLGIIQPIDVPDNLALLDETLSNMRERLINHQDQIDVNSDLSVRFDCLLHTLETIVNLTKQVPELNVNSQETLKKPMDNIARIMNGLKKTLYKQ